MADTLTAAQLAALEAIFDYSASDGDISNGAAPTEGQLADVADRVLGGTGSPDSPLIALYQAAIALKADFTDPEVDPSAMLIELQVLIDGENANLSRLFEGEFTFNEGYVVDWDVSQVTNMSGMFVATQWFDQNIGAWNVGNVMSMTQMFAGAAAFNQDIGRWKVGNVTDMSNMFYNAGEFDQNIGGWDVSKVADMERMFYGAKKFNQNIGDWDVSNVTNMGEMFRDALVFNQDIGGWEVGKVTDMNSLFYEAAAFNQDIGGWDVSKVEDMDNLFSDAVAFNQDISGWVVSKVERMGSMFADAEKFNQDIGGWDVSNVTHMSSMFYNADAFNQDIGGWEVGNVANMATMFSGTEIFNQDIGGWDVSKVEDMGRMFFGAQAFNQDIGGWDISFLTDADKMLDNSGMSVENFDKLLAGWSTLDGTRGETNINSSMTLGALGLEYTDATSYHRLADATNYGWTIDATRAATYTDASGNVFTIVVGDKDPHSDNHNVPTDDTFDNSGGSDRQYIHGLDGNDTLKASKYGDILVGGAGNDDLHGGDGVDRFVYKYDDDGEDTIYGFNIDEDILDLTQLLIGITDQNHDLGDYIQLSDPILGHVTMTIDHDGQDGGNQVTIILRNVANEEWNPAAFLDSLKINYNRPTAITLDSASVDEDIEAGGDIATARTNASSLVGILSTVDADKTDSFTYSIEVVPNTDGALFEITDGDQLTFIGSADHETQDSYQVAVRVIDQYGNTQVEMLTIEVNDYVGRYTGNKRGNTVTGSSENDVMKGKKGKDKLDGAVGTDILRGGNGHDVLNGGEDNDKLGGGKGRDNLAGGVGADVLIGGKGADRLEGDDPLIDDDAADIFKFTSATHIGKKAGKRDIIVSFDQFESDQINLSRIDAKSGRSGDQAFRLIEDDAFSGKKGELRFKELVSGDTLVMGDINGDGKADFRLQILDMDQTLTEEDFIL